MFKKYIHLERFGTDEVDGINIGDCFIFPKIDGTNACIWNEDGKLQCGSRNRHLSVDDDNAGFCQWAIQQDNLIAMITAYPELTFYGEWLVPHSLRTYREDSWRKFYIFDVLNKEGEFLHYNEYSEICKQYQADYIPCTLKSRNPDYEILITESEKNKFLIDENKGIGEGIVIKQYGFKNRFGRTTWAKLITNHFKDKHILEMGGSVVNNKMIEDEIVDKYTTIHIVDKIIAKIRTDQGSFSAKNIPQLLSSAYHDLITEEMWQILKEYKNPKIDFKTLNHIVINKVKTLKPELFGISR